MLGNRLKQLREEKKLKQEDLAKKLAVSPSAIGMYERNEREPNDELTLKMSNFFDVSTDYLLGKTDKRKDDIDFNSDMIKIGLSTKEYKEPTAEQKKQIEDFAKFVLKDNKKKENK